MRRSTKKHRNWKLIGCAIAVLLVSGIGVTIAGIRADPFNMVDRGAADEFRAFLDHGGDPNLRKIPALGGRVNETSLLHRAVKHNNLDACEQILRHGGDPNRLDGAGCTPLVRVAIFEDEGPVRNSIFDLLLRVSDLKKTDPEGKNVLHYAGIYGNEAAYEKIKKLDSSLESSKDHDGKIPLELLRRALHTN